MDVRVQQLDGGRYVIEFKKTSRWSRIYFSDLRELSQFSAKLEDIVLKEITKDWHNDIH